MDEFLSLGLLLNRSSVSIGKYLNDKLLLHGIDLPHSQFIVLRCLHYRSGISQNEIAKLLFKDAAAIKRTIDNLEKKGLIIREQERLLKNRIYVSDKGKAILPKILAIADTATKDVLAGINAGQYDQLRKMLDIIYQNTIIK
ncbi:MarR family transcriptional regulator [Dysgonomonas sp.]|jgi:DNA-binding MarR family transcriptional regulator|nr:MarR family transcriptional regulator [Prevotella sp.]